MHSGTTPRLFQLMRNERLLEALETFLGPEISVSSRYHLNLKLSRRHMAIAASIAAAVGQIVPSDFLPRTIASNDGSGLIKGASAA